MADSDGENEKFVKNVIHELSAFEVPEKPSASENNEETPGEGSSQQANSPGDQVQGDSEPPKPPSRVIRLSRPLNPYGSSRQTPNLSSSNAPSGTSSSVTGSTASVSGAPGSRLAALQRPGSPMHKFLQRSKSPALAAAAARLGQQNAPEPSNDKTAANSEADNPAGGTDPGNRDISKTNESEPPSQSSSSLRSTMPPRIPSSGIASSILHRRPQSPLRTSRTSLLTKQSSENTHEEGPISPRSPPSDAQDNLNSTLPAGDAEKEAIRNKLRANSFRLKGLLEKRPFVRARGQSENETKDDTSAVKSAESLDEQATSSTSDKTSTRDRTRWRAEGSNVTSSQRSRLTERTNSLLSSRSSYVRSKMSQDSSDKDNDISKETPDENTSMQNENNESSNIKNGSIDSYKHSSNDGINGGENPINANAEKQSLAGKITAGATLLRSPRTRAISVDSSVPSSPDNTVDTGEKESDNNATTSRAAFTERRAHTLSELEKESDVNLVFDSNTIGQDNSSPENDTSDGNRQSDMAKSMYAGSHSRAGASVRPRVSSEPATPITEQRSLTNSQSFEKSLDADFLGSSPHLKRSFAVTDLDKAMWERDKQKLSSIFKDASKDQGEETKEDRHQAPGKGQANNYPTEFPSANFVICNITALFFKNNLSDKQFGSAGICMPFKGTLSRHIHHCIILDKILKKLF